MSIKLASEHVQYIEEALNTMVNARQRVPDVMSDAHTKMAYIAQYVATTAGHGAAVELLQVLLQNVKDGEQLLSTLNDGFKMKVALQRTLAQL